MQVRGRNGGTRLHEVSNLCKKRRKTISTYDMNRYNFGERILDRWEGSEIERVRIKENVVMK